MAFFTESQGVIFTEDSLDLPVIGSLRVQAATQNTTLAEVKAEMARKALALGGNGVVRYAYTQKADKPLKNIFSFKWDTERLTLTGDVVRFEQDPRG